MKKENISKDDIRRMDDLGRVVIKKSIRNELNLEDGDYFEISLEDDNTITLRPMKAMVVRKFDDLGRVVIPKEIAKKLNAGDLTAFNVIAEDGVVKMTKID